MNHPNQNPSEGATSFENIKKPEKAPVDWEKIRLLIFDCDGVLTDGRIIYGCEGEELKNFNALDGMGFMLLRDLGIRTAVITGRRSAALQRRCEDLKIDFLYQGIANKRLQTQDLLSQLGLSWENVLFMGDDWNDIPAMFAAAVSVAPCNAPKDVAALADFVMSGHGGFGAVRKCIEMVLKGKGLYEQAVLAYLARIS